MAATKNDPYDEKEPWPAPDPWQCAYVNEDGKRCIFGKAHTVNYHLCKTQDDLPPSSAFSEGET